MPERRSAAGWQLYDSAASGNDNKDSLLSARHTLCDAAAAAAAAAEENTDAAAEDSVAAATSDNSHAEVPLGAKQAKVVSTVIRCLLASETRVPGPERMRVACKPIILSIEDEQGLCDFCSAP